MSKRSKRAGLILIVVLFAVSVVAASEGTSKPAVPEAPEAPTASPEQQAIEHYNTGLMLRDKARKVEEEAASQTDEARRDKMQNKVTRLYERAVSEFRSAVEKNPALHEAHSSLGYALRKSGEFDAAIEAYDTALRLAPGYAEAIEYRAEAYLGLDRIEEAKQAYIQLFEIDRDRADELLAAMKVWVDSRKADPAGVAPDAVRQLSDWLGKRAQIASNTTTVSRTGGDW